MEDRFKDLFECIPREDSRLCADTDLPGSHRHLSNLMALHPFNLITTDGGEVDRGLHDRPTAAELADAVRHYVTTDVADVLAGRPGTWHHVDGAYMNALDNDHLFTVIRDGGAARTKCRRCPLGRRRKRASFRRGRSRA